MARYMLIDATHKEETRVALVKNNRLEDFDFETKTKPQIKSNIYLAKVVRVEPSLQAAFVDFGGNRHGFLAFSEIHPDYYRVPVSDRKDSEKEEDGDKGATESFEKDADLLEERSETGEVSGDFSQPEVEILGGIEGDEVSARKLKKTTKYKIQEVIKKRQIMLVQVIKEERGNKGAALTTYLSLAGRYCVLMPNAGREGGISRKITDSEDRKRLRSIVDSLEVPEGMGLILRTAGMERTKAEIKRDYDYLIGLWNDIRTMTLKSTAPTLIHEEGALIKRAIRDLYSREIDKIIVEGSEGYQSARNFIKKLTPSHGRKVEEYKNLKLSLFQSYKIDEQIESIFSPVVPLPSGGYLVVSQTEALVSIDVNSGRATRERHIEETALKTNMEAAYEAARQLRLRNLAGLVVIDFIDMEDNRNITAVEKRLKESMAEDKARIQIGRISPFGLLELSRQRLRPSILEAHTGTCPHCKGTGVVRLTESSVLHILRQLDIALGQSQEKNLLVFALPENVVYILNYKRKEIMALEHTHGMSLVFQPDSTLGSAEFKLEKNPDAYLIRQEETLFTRPQTKGTEEAHEVTEEEKDIDDEKEDTSFLTREREPKKREDRSNTSRRRRHRKRKFSSENKEGPIRPVAEEGVPSSSETEWEETEQDSQAFFGLTVDSEEQSEDNDAPASVDSLNRRRRRRRRRREWPSKSEDRVYKNDSTPREYPKGELLSYGKEEGSYETPFLQREGNSSFSGSEESGSLKRHPRKGWWQRLIKK